MKKYIVNVDEVGKRIDAYLSSKNEELSRVTIQRLIDEEKILVNDKKMKASYKVQAGDLITLEEEVLKEVSLKAQDIPIEVIYEDKDIIVVNKPKGLVVHPANGNPDGTLVNAIMTICKDSLSGIGGELRPGIVHRLDKDTSGILVIAKNDKAHINMSEQIKNHLVEKTYIALVRGIVKENEASINMPIGRSDKDRKKMAVKKNGKEAITHFNVLERYPKHNCTLLEVKIETGRTHQIRVHLSHIGYPIIGDEVYSSGKNEWNIKGQCLHARSLKFKHPITNKEMYLEAELPEYFKNVVKQLGTGSFCFTKSTKNDKNETKGTCPQCSKMRLQKFLAEAGIASRRKAEELVLQGKVSVNGKVITELGTQVIPGVDKIEYNGAEIKIDDDYIYILLNKPIGYVTTAKDQFGRDSVLDLVKTDKRLVPVGRLDMYTSGALILTNDGDFVYKVTHPKHEIEKTYTVTIKGIATNEEANKLRIGIQIEDYITKPAKVKILKIDEEKNQSRLEITIHEGKNRQIRKMCEAIGHKVLALHRSKIAGIGVKDIPLRKMEVFK